MAVSRKSKKEIIEENEALRSRLELLERSQAEHREVEKALRESEARFRTVIESLPFDFFLIDQTGRYAMLNKVCKQDWGDVIGKRPEEICPDEETLALWQSNNRRAFAGEVVEGEVVLKPQGREGYYRNIISPIRDGGKIQGILGVNIDITRYKDAERALQETNQLLEKIFDTTHVLIAYIDSQCNFIKVNKAFALADKKEPSFFPGKNIFDLYPNEENKEICRWVLETGESYFADAKPFGYAEHPECGVSYWDWSLIPIKNQHNSVTALVLSLANVTERKQAEEALRETEGQLSAMLQSVGDHMSMMDKDLNIIWANEKARNIFGEDIVGRKCYKAYHRREKPCEPYPCLTLKAFQDGKVHKHDTQVLDKDGQIIYFHCTANVALKDANGKPTAVLEISRDITERKKAEQAVRNERDKAQKYLDVAGIMLVAIDVEERVGLVNKKGCEILGYKEEDIIGKKWFDNFLPERVKKEVKAVFKKLMAGKLEPVEYFENPILTKDGDERLIAWHNTLLRAEQGDIIGTLSSGEDITERKKAEKALQLERDNFINILDSMEDGIYIVDQNYDIQYVNPILKKDFGPYEERKCYEYFHDRREVCPWCKNKEVFEGKTVRWEWYSFKNQKTYDLIDTPLRNLDGSTSKLEIFRDITERKQSEEALRESELKFKTIFENAGGAIFIANRKTGEILECNSQAEQMLGRPRAEIVGMHQSELHPKGEEEKYKEKFAAHVQKGHVVDFEGEMQHRDGRRIPVWIAAQCLKIGGKDVIIGLFVDTTERKKAEEAVRESEQKYRALVEQSLQGIIIFQDFQIVFANPMAAEIAGLTVESLLALSPEDIKTFIPAEERAVILQRFEDRLAGKPVQHNYELRLMRQNGNEFWLNMFISQIEYLGKSAIQVVFIDITERKRTEEALRESDAFSSSLLCNSPNPILVINPDTSVKYVNPAIEKITGFSSAEIIGKKAPYLWWTEETLHSTGRDLKKAMSKGAVSLEELFKKKDGERFWVEITSGPIIENGKFKYYLANWIDITERKQAEQKLIENRAKLKSLASQLSLIEERERHRFATYLHDQIGQSLAMSKMKLDSLRKSISSSESAEVLKDVCSYLGHIIQDTRTLTFDLSFPILYELGFEAAVAEWLDEQIREKHGIKTEFEDDGQPKPLDDDIRVFLFRNVRELLVNVVRHANAKNVKVSICKVDDRMCVSVEDDGVGFDVTEVESMVTKKAKFGLFSIQERLESVGGHFEIESEPGHGSRITMLAPLKGK